MRLSHLTIAALLSGGCLFATPRTWTFSGVTFADGGTLSGSFVFDSTTNTYSNVNITTSGGALPSRHYVVVTSGSPAGLFAVESTTGAGTPAIAILYTDLLDDTVTSRGVQTASGEGTCAVANCSSVLVTPGPTTRLFASGNVVAPPIATSVPTLSTWALAALAGLLSLVGYCQLRRRATVQ